MLCLKTCFPFGYWIIFHVFLLSADFFFKFNFFEKKIFQECIIKWQANWTQIWPAKMAGLIWIPTDQNDYHQTTVNRPTLLSSPSPKFIKLFPC